MGTSYTHRATATRQLRALVLLSGVVAVMGGRGGEVLQGDSGSGSGGTPPPPPPPPPPAPVEFESENEETVPVVIGVVLAFLVVMGALLYYYFYAKRNRPNQNLLDEEDTVPPSPSPAPPLPPASSPLAASPATTPISSVPLRTTRSSAAATSSPPTTRHTSRTSSSAELGVSSARPRFAVGDRVATVAPPHRPGQITSVDATELTYCILFDDGTTGTAHLQITLKEGPPRFAVGARVSVRDPLTGQATVGHVEGNKNGAYSVRLGNQLRRDLGEEMLSHARRFKEADQVFFTANGVREGAVVTDLHDDGSYTLLLCNTLSSEIGAPDIHMEKRKDIEFEIGMKVYGRRGGATSLAAAGVIEALGEKDVSYVVRFEDGTKETVEARWMLPRGDEVDPLEGSEDHLGMSLSQYKNGKFPPPCPRKRQRPQRLASLTPSSSNRTSYASDVQSPLRSPLTPATETSKRLSVGSV